jgi:hypothetical protein
MPTIGKYGTVADQERRKKAIAKIAVSAVKNQNNWIARSRRLRIPAQVEMPAFA